MENKSQLWDFVKCRIRSETIAYSIQKSRTNRLKEETIKKTLENLEASLATDCSHLDAYYEAKQEWENFQKIKLKGSILRSKSQWVEDGEQNSKFFLNLEKRNYSIKHIKKLIQGTNIITDPVAILKEQKRYYDTLYSSKQHHFENFIEIEDYFLRNTAIPKLSNDERYFCDQKLQPRDYSTALKNLANNKSPGSDGLTTNFYKFFWPDIRDLLVASYNYTYDNNQLSQEQKIAVINLLPKKDKDLRFLKNWCPVSLLYTDYKILTKALAQKLQNVIGQIVNCDQIGYIKGRFIGETIHTIHDIVYLTEEQNMNGFITLIDFEKAFDSIEWNLLFKCLKRFNSEMHF